jgi:hypothetical protein
METNETAKGAQYQAAEQELMKLIEEVEGLEEGDLEGLEEKIYQGVFKIGRKLMEGGMRKGQESELVPTKMVGECGHQHKLVGYRSKKLLTLFGEVEWKRAYYPCQVEEDKEPAAEQEQAPKCSHVGKALAEKEDEVVKALFEEALQSQTQEQEQASQKAGKDIERLSIELDGILARMRRGSVPMEEDERKRKGDVYREMKVGAVFLAERGPERSELAPEVWVDTCHPQAVCATLLGARLRAALASCSMRWLSSQG